MMKKEVPKEEVSADIGNLGNVRENQVAVNEAAEQGKGASPERSSATGEETGPLQDGLGHLHAAAGSV